MKYNYYTLLKYEILLDGSFRIMMDSHKVLELIKVVLGSLNIHIHDFKNLLLLCLYLE